MRRAALFAAVMLCAAAAAAMQERAPSTDRTAVDAAGSVAPPRNAPALRTPALDAAADDARRAAAARLLAASRFRERQAVLIGDSIRAAEADLTAECVDRAAAGRSLDPCRTSAAATARIAARRSDMLDEIMAASQGVYARRFSAAEMEEITRFFRTPVGRKYGDLYPEVIAEVQARKGAVIRRYLLDATRPLAPPRVGAAATSPPPKQAQ